MIAVYSAHPSAPLSLYARAQSFDFAGLDALRLPAMRSSIHLLPRATAHLAFRALAPTRRTEASRMKYFGLTPERYAEIRAATLQVTDEPRSSAELKQLLGVGDELRGALGAMGREGAIMRVGAEGLRSNALKYVRADIAQADAAQALAWLAEEYLRAYGPARAKDFVWWTGVPAKDARAALATVDTVEVEDGLLLRRADERDYERAPKPGGVDLLPKWDMLTMGYPKDGRARFAHDDVVDRCYDFRGDGMPLVLSAGEAVATWPFRFAGRTMEVEIDWFEPPGRRLVGAVTSALEEVAGLLGATTVSGHR